MAHATKTMLLLALGVALAASMFAAPFAGATSTIAASPTKAVTITLYGSGSAPAMGWGLGPNNITEPGPTLTVQQGDVITFHLFSNDSMQHQLIIDLDNSHANSTGDAFSPIFASRTTAIDFVYTASTAGTFAYLCAIHGYNVQHGTLTVTAAPPPPTDYTLVIVGGVVVVVVIAGAGAAMRMRKKKPGQPGQPGP